MAERPLDRREFLKLAAASAAAAGLSHFRFLNIGGAGVALARPCEPGDTGESDTCEAGVSTDWCIPASMDGGDPDVCEAQDPGPGPADMCPDDSPQGDGDICAIGGDQDACMPESDEADTCGNDFAGASDPDICVGDTTGDGDVCGARNPPHDLTDVCTQADADTCDPGYSDPDSGCDEGMGFENDVCGDVSFPFTPDTCDPITQQYDACEPVGDEPEGDVCLETLVDLDICPDGAGGDGDFCDPTWNPPEPDVCSPPWDDPDDSGQPNPVTLASLEAGSPGSGLPLLGGVAALAAAAAILLRRRFGQEEEGAE